MTRFLKDHSIKAGDKLLKVHKYSGEVRSLQTVTVEKVYKTGKFVLVEDNDTPQQQWGVRDRWSDESDICEPTGDRGYSRRSYTLEPLENRDKYQSEIEARREKNNQRQLQTRLSGILAKAELQSPDVLTQIAELLGEQ